MKRLRIGSRPRRLMAVLAVLAIIAVSAGGCGSFGYLASVAGGQLDILLGSRPIEAVLASGELTDQQAERLRFILDVRQFGIERIGLDAGNSYTLFYDTEGQPPAYNLSASRKDAFKPFTWSFPVVGKIPYLGFFSLEDAKSEAEMLKEQRLDVLLLPVAAYSTLGFFDDPVFSSMLERDEAGLADVVLHELTHSTVFRPGDISFNESLATFVGRTASLMFLRERFGADAPIVTRAWQLQEDADRYNAFLARLYETLDAFYRSDRTTAEKLTGREAIYRTAVDEFDANELPLFHQPEVYDRILDLELNNAWILANRRYNLDLDLFAQVYEAVGQNFPAALAVFSAAADADDSKAFLRQWLADPTIERP